MKFLLTQKMFSSRLALLGVFLLSFMWFFGTVSVASAQLPDGGDGLYFYGITGSTMPYVKAYDNSGNTFGATSTTATGSVPHSSAIKSSPTKLEMVAGYVDSTGVLQVMCFTGTTWTNEWTATVGGDGERQRFDIGYETETGDVMVLYSGNTGSTNELKYRTKSGNSGCGSGNWSSENNLDPVRTSGTVEIIKIATHKNSGSSLMTAIWADNNSDLSAMTWSGTAWGNEHTAALETSLEVVTAAQDVESFDVVYESSSGDVMVAWGSGGTDGTNGAYYAVCTGGTASCTWGSVRTAMPTFLDDATHISMAADPLSDRIVFASLGDAGGDLQYGIWSGSAWTNTANADNSSSVPQVDRMWVGTGWVNNNGHKKAIVTYQDSAAVNLGWRSASGTTWTIETDVTPTTSFSTAHRYTVKINPFNQSELMFALSGATSQAFAKRLAMNSSGALTWTQPDAGRIAIGMTTLGTRNSIDYEYWQNITPLQNNLSGTLYLDDGQTVAAAGKTIKMVMGTSTPSVFSTTTNSSGQWSFLNVTTTGVVSGTPITFFLDGDTSRATALVSGYTGGVLSGIPLYYNTLTAYGADSEVAIPLEEFDVYDSSDDADILYTASSTEFIAHGPLAIKRGEVVAPASLVLEMGYENEASFTAGAEVEIGGYLADFVSGVDISGASTGTISGITYTVAEKDGYVFLGKIGQSDACSQTPGSARGCELQVYDVRDPENPVYVAGRDASGNSAGTASQSILTLTVVGDYLYVGKAGNPTACSQSAGSAIGCELMVFSIIDPTNPVFLAGRDASGNSAGTGDVSIHALTFTEEALFVSKGGDATACSQSAGSAIGCELMVFDISSPANPTYVAGRDVAGSATGALSSTVESLVVAGTYLYLGKSADGTACSQSVGSANGCELQVYDISTPATPTYVAGRDVSGDSTGTGSLTINQIVAADGYLYIGKNGNATACSQTPGSAIGCELMVFSITTPTNPTYVAGRDVSGTTAGTVSAAVHSSTVAGSYLYQGISTDSTTCTQTLGSAIGCELQVFDVSVPTSPTYVAGRDGSGSFTNRPSLDSFSTFSEMIVVGNRLLLANNGDDTVACQPAAGLAGGCELQQYNLAAEVVGFATGTNALGDTTITKSGAHLTAETTVANLLMASGVLSAPDTLRITGHLDYDGGSLNLEGGEVVLAGTNKDVSGNFTGDNTFDTLRVTGSYEMTTTASTTNLFIETGGELTAPSLLSVERRMHSDGVFDDNNGTVLLGQTDTNIGEYAYGISRQGVVAPGGGFFGDLGVAIMVGTYMYVGTEGYESACSQTPGSAGECSLLVFDMSDPDAPVLVYSLSGGGSAAGTSGGHIVELLHEGNYVYAGKKGNSTACSQTPGSAVGCEIMVFDVSNPALPVYVAGRDVSGNAAGTASKEVMSLAFYNNHLYVGVYPDSTACSQSAGSAIGCELLVFDVSTPTSPTYVAGRDGDGSTNGTTGAGFEAGTRDMEVVDNYLYVARSADGECYVVAGQAEGCTLQIYDIATGSNPTLVGTLTNNGQRTGNFNFSEFWALAVSGDYLYVGKAGSGRGCEQGSEKTYCEVQVYDISSTTNPVFASGMDMSGDPGGGAGFNSGVVDLEVADGYLYVVKLDQVESCLPLAGSAEGCYLHIYDLASSTDPILVSARDSFGTYGMPKNSNRATPRDIMVYNGRVFVTGFEAGTYCSNGIGGFYSCGISVFEAGTAGVITGDFTGASSLGDVVVYGTTVVAGIASTSDLTLVGDIFTLSPTTLTVGGHFDRAAGDVLFSRNATLEIVSNSAQTVSGEFTDLSLLPNVYFAGSGAKTITDTASTSHVTVASGASVTFESPIEIRGALTNAGTFVTEAGLDLYGLYNNSGSADIETALALNGSPIVGLVGGIDGSGLPFGTGSQGFTDVVSNDGYLYTSKRGSGSCATDLSQGDGCQLQIFDVTDPSNIEYVAGYNNNRETDVTSFGDLAYALATAGEYLYVGRQGNGDPCTNSAAHLGCEIVVYDISSSTNPVFAAGRDSDGSALGTTDTTDVVELLVSGDYLFVGKEANSTACSQSAGSAIGCEIMVFDVTDPTDPVYIAGIDANASAAGGSSQEISALEVVGDYLYIGKDGNDTACSQSAGSAIGCELLVFDISDPDNPVYAAGRDSGGTAAGTRSAGLTSIKGDGLYLYAGYNSDFGDCDESTQEVCNIKVYNITTPASLAYVGGASPSGPLGQSAGAEVFAIEIYGDILYIGKQPNGVGCNTLMPDSDLNACEIMAFDISSSTNPVYLDARDVNGGENSSHDFGIAAMTLADGYLYTVIRSRFDNPSANACIPIAGFAEGCDIQVYSLKHTLAGNMTGTNAFPDTTIGGVGAEFLDNAATRDFTFLWGEVIAPTVLTVSGDFIHNAQGTFIANGGEVVLAGADQNVVGTTTFYDLTKQATGAATTTFEAGSLTTVLNNFTFSGTSTAARHVLRSSVNTQYWYLNASSTEVSNLAVRDSNNLNVTTITCAVGCLDNGNNVNWSLESITPLTFLSASPHTFYFTQATTTLGSFVITEASSSTINTVNDLRIRIATTTTNFRFNVGTTNLSFGGTAAGKVSGTVSYEQGGAVLVINVTTNFTAGDTLVIDGIKVGSFAAASAETSVFALYTNGSITGEPAALDTQPIRILGGLILEDHPEGQVDNKFGPLNVDDGAFFAFMLETVGEQTVVEDFTLTLLGLGELTTENLLNFRLYRDTNSDLELDGGDLLIDGGGIFTISGQHGAVTFSTNFTASSSANYLVIADTSAIPRGASVNMLIESNAFTGVGSVSGVTPVLISSVSPIQHIRANAGSTGGSVGISRVGGNAPAGASTETGGGSGAGTPVGQMDGENIAADADFYQPTTSGSGDNEWTNGANALLSDGTYATAASTNLRQSYSGFPFVIPNGNSIQGIGIKIDASGSTPAGTIDVALSWDGGESYTTAKATPTLSGGDLVYVIGGPSDLWGRTWTASEFEAANFRVRVTAGTDNNTLRLDALEVRVYHQTGGGSSGGGSGGGRS